MGPIESDPQATRHLPPIDEADVRAFGDPIPEQAAYTMRWSRAALNDFVDLFNGGDVRDAAGRRLRVELVDHGFNEVGFTFTPEAVDEPPPGTPDSLDGR